MTGIEHSKTPKMVSTRGVRYKFSEGERVLCYEPDPTKAKVLYDSKVLEVIENKDKRGRRTIEYLIHFQGWNSSWDRCVSEDFVLKDTEENRQLQNDLAERSQLQLGAYLYRRERKKGNGSGSSAASGGIPKRARNVFSDDGSSSSTQQEGEEGEAVDTDSSGDGSRSQPTTPPPTNVGRAHITLPSPLRDRLTFDYHLVVKRGRLSQLPASPCAAEILEAFVKWYARAGAWHPTRSRHDPPHKPDMHDVSCRLNLVREVADGLRVYFDFTLRGHLLYKQEHDQFHDICGKFLDAKDNVNPDDHSMFMMYDPEKAAAQAEANMKSPQLPEYSHLPPTPLDPFKNLMEATGHSDLAAFGHLKKPTSSSRSGKSDGVKINLENAFFSTKTETPSPKTEAPAAKTEAPAAKTEAPAAKTEAPAVKTEVAAYKAEASSFMDEILNAPTMAGKMREQRSALRIGNVARRLRSHKSAVSQSENEEPTPSTSTGEPRTFETVSSSVGSSGSSLSEGWSRPPQAAAAAPTAPTTSRTPLSLLLEKVAKWQIVPRNDTEHLPCRVYGAIHLARLFVKLPDFLNATQMPDYKLKMLLKHIDMFVQFLDEHTEWFGETYYIAENSSRSH